MLRIAQVPVTRVCVETIIRGVPVGAQIAWLSNSNNGCPLEVIRVAEVIHCAVTHGPLPAIGGGIAQPAMTQTSAMVSVGMPLTVTRGFTATGCA
jgi:hypothetical protein